MSAEEEIKEIDISLERIRVNAPSKPLKRKWTVCKERSFTHEDHTVDPPIRTIYNKKRYRKYELVEGRWKWIESGAINEMF